MIGALLGFTPQEGDVLQGYSDDDKDSDHKNGDEHVLASSPQPLSLKFKSSNVVNPLESRHYLEPTVGAPCPSTSLNVPSQA
ncbi:hypothetical protein YC2023_023392 [Brassica napus]